jgi:GNAT superfamily N-acetyltransferase
VKINATPSTSSLASPAAGNVLLRKEMGYEITFHENPPAEDLLILEEGLDSKVSELFPNKSRTHVAFFLRDENGEIAGGVSGNHGTFGWLYVSTLWVREDLRGRGFGRELMKRIEAEAVRHGCKNVFLNTMSFQAPEFYEKLGYTVFAELEDFPGEHSRMFFRKKLA